jgi:kinesin family protein 20
LLPQLCNIRGLWLLILIADPDSEEERDELVEYLFQQLGELRVRLLQSEMQNATIEAETREEVVKEMQDRLQDMQQLYERRLQDEVRIG